MILQIGKNLALLVDTGAFFAVVFRTVLYVVCCIPLFFSVGLILALILNDQHLPGRTFFRVALILPWGVSTSAIIASVKKTHRVLIAHEDKVFGGFGGELAAIVASECFPWLDAPIERVGSEFTPVGFNRILERAILPNTDKVLAAARKVLAF